MLRRSSLALLLLASALAAQPQVQWTHLQSSAGDLPAPGGSGQQTACLVADFDLDGRDDILVASRQSAGRIELWRNDGTSWNKDLVEPSNVRPEAGGAVHDVDGDGDPDFVLGQDASGDDLYWWENPNPSFGAPWTRRLIKSGLGNKHHDQAFGDFDGDGAVELVSWNQNATALLLFDIPANPAAAGLWPRTTIFSPPSSNYEGLAVGDVDGDGVDDIVGAGRWFKHVGGGSYAIEVVDAAATFTRAAVGQLVPGGRPEIVFTPGDINGNASWYQWNGSSWVAQPLDSFLHGHTLELADVNGDGHLDIFAGEMKIGSPQCELRIYYGDGTGSFTKAVIDVGNGIHEGRLGDLDGDGDLDIAHKPYNDGTPRLDVWINEGATIALDQWATHLADAALPHRAIFVQAGDLDGDGLDDLVAGAWWYPNPGAASGPWNRITIGAPFQNLAAIHDFDGDGDLDLLGTQGIGSSRNADFAWAENDGTGSFTVHTNIPSGTGDFLQGVAVARFGGASAPLQVALSWHAGGNGVQVLTVPAQPAVQPWSWSMLSPVSQDEALSAGDLDADGDLDLLLGTLWLENPSWSVHAIGSVADLPGVGGTPKPDRNRVADVDQDGDLDAVLALEDGQDVVWFENPGPAVATGPWTRHRLGIAAGQGFSLDVADFDLDGDVDVVLGEHQGNPNRVLIFENAGAPTAWPVTVVDSQPASVIDHHDGTRVVDLEGDGDPDIVSIGWFRQKLWVFENLGLGGMPPPGPTAQPPSIETPGAYRAYRSVTLSSPTSGAEIRYTLDGSDPDAASTLYQVPFVVGDVTTVKARAFEPGLAPSPVVGGSFARIDDERHAWRFDETAGSIARDAAPNGVDGTIVGPAIAAGRFRNALDFDGIDDRVELGSLDLPGGALTLSVWFRADTFASSASLDPRLVSKATGVAEQDHVWMLSTLGVGGSPRLRFRLKTDGTTSTLVASTGVVPTGEWVHAAATYDGATMRLFLNGVEVGSLAAAGSITPDPTAMAWIGDNPPTAGSRPFDGLIDTVSLFSRALSSEEVAALASSAPYAGILDFGESKPACDGVIDLEAIAAPTSGQPAFGVACAAAPPLAGGLLAIAPLPANPGVPILDFTVWVDLPTALLLPVSADAAGRLLVPAPLTGLPPGTAAFLQCAWMNPPGCGPGLLSTSQGLGVVVQ